MIIGYKSGPIAAILFGLAACGSASDVSFQPTPPNVDDPTPTSSDFSVLNDGFIALQDQVPSLGSDPSLVPATYSGTFTGYFSGELDPDVNTTAADINNGDVDFIAGDAQIVIDVVNDSGSIFGAAGNFQSDTVDDIDGTIVLFDFVTTRGSNAVVYEGTYSGKLTVTDADYPTGEQNAAGRFFGGYFGNDGQLISLITTPVDGFNDIYFDGDIVVERD